MSRLIMAFCLIAAMGGCAGQTGSFCPSGAGAPQAVFTLFMGEAIPGREDLTEQEWQAFLDTVITVNLPNGYTVFDARGGWMNPISRKSIQEATKVLLVALPETPESVAAIGRIRSAYQTAFRQQLVGMTVVPGCAAF